MALKSIRSLDLSPGTRVLLRVDINEPVDANGYPQDDFRIKKMLPTIQFLYEKQAKIILVAHLGDPHSQDRIEVSLSPILKYMSTLIGISIQEVADIVGDGTLEAVKSLGLGEILALPNIRFDPREEEGSDALALQLAQYADIYVNDAFSVCHRNHTSVVNITKFLPSYAGLQLEKEVELLKAVLEQPKRPAIAIIGGAKIKTKLPVIEVLKVKYDAVLVGGKIANEYLDLYGDDLGDNVILPEDFRNRERFDIGDKTIAKFCEYIKGAKTIIWNGPLGWFENPPNDISTKMVAQAIADNYDSYSLIGGGETVDEIYNLHQEGYIDFISTGGGAMLAYIINAGVIPGIQALDSVDN